MQWLSLVLSLLALAAGVFALMRANRVQASARRAARRVDHAAVGITRVAMVRFDAFTDSGGSLSSAAALLDDSGDGLVITTLNGRESSRTYIKQVQRGRGLSALSPEEAEAVAKAMRS